MTFTTDIGSDSRMNGAVRQALYRRGWFTKPGAHVLVDGQYGSTGKGVAASLLAVYAVEQEHVRIDWVGSNAGPNSGHTAMVLSRPGEGTDSPHHVWINKQVPIATSVLDKLGKPALTVLNGGAVIDPETLLEEFSGMSDCGRDLCVVHRHAAVVRDEDRRANKDMVSRIASTGKGTAPAAAARMLRTGETYGEWLARPNHSQAIGALMPSVASEFTLAHMARVSPGLLETSQGFSLGINSGFYPHCTHRECTVGQALADAQISPKQLRQVMMCVRSFPIRVGNTENSSGGCYPDQMEIQWSDLGLAPELTTVTKRVRRLFTWSRMQFRDALLVNQPSAIFFNFANYMQPAALVERLRTIHEDIHTVMAGSPQPLVLLGYGPGVEHVVVDRTYSAL